MSVSSTAAAKKWAASFAYIQRKAYWILGILLVGFVAYFYYTGLNRPVAGVLWFLGGFIVLYYYWIKWFLIPKQKDPDFNPDVAGVCPDYLSIVPPDSGFYKPTSRTQYFCVDYIGVSKNGGLKKITPGNFKDSFKHAAYRFSVDPSKDFKTAQGRAEFLKRLNAAGLSYTSLDSTTLPTRTDAIALAPTGLTSVSGRSMAA
jgi:hypothetical protein